jgi:hypothetical protein
MAEVTLTLRDAPEGIVTVRSTFIPAVGQRTTPAQAIGMDLHNIAAHRADVIALEPENQGVGMPTGCEAITHLSPKAGDLLVFRCRQRMTKDQAEHVRQYIKDHVPAGVSVLVLDSAFEVEQTQAGASA